MNKTKRIERMTMDEVNEIYDNFIEDLESVFAKVQRKINQGGARVIHFKEPIRFTPHGYGESETKEIRVNETGEIEVVWAGYGDTSNVDEFTLQGTVEFYAKLLNRLECIREEKGEKMFFGSRYKEDYVCQ